MNVRTFDVVLTQVVELLSFPIYASIASATLILGVSYLLTCLLRVRSASLAHLVYASGLLGVLCLPLLVCLNKKVSIAVNLPVTQETRESKPSKKSDLPIAEPNVAQPEFDRGIRHVEPGIAVSELSNSNDNSDDSTSSLRTGQTEAINRRHRTSPQDTNRQSTQSPTAGSDTASLRLGGQNVISLIWIIGSAVFASRLVAAAYYLHSVKAQSYPASSRIVKLADQMAKDFEMRDTCHLRIADASSMPIAFWWLGWTIVLPNAAAMWSESRLRSVLAHELAHVARRDARTDFVGQLAGIIYWFQPLVWICIADCRRLRELACDEFVLERTNVERIEYANQLVEVIRECERRRFPLVSAMAGPSDIERRIRRIVNAQKVPLPCNTHRRGLIACLTLLVLGSSLIRWTVAEGQSTSPSVSQESNSINSSEQTTAYAESEVDKPYEAGVVQGVLVDSATSQPVAGANVLLRGSRLDRTKSDTAGRFRFEQVKLDEHGYRLWAYRDNLVTGRKSLKFQSDGTWVSIEPQRLTMAPGRQIEFNVAEQQSGHPIKNATIRLGYPDRRAVETNADGAAIVSGLDAERYLAIVEADGYARFTVRIDLSSKTARPTYHVSLSPGGSVIGQIVDERGNTIGEVDVTYREPGSSGYYGDSSRTDADGRFRHRFLPLNVAVEVSIEKQGYLPERRDVSLTTDQRKRDVTVVLRKRPPGASVVGVVRDENGAPISGAVVANHGRSGSRTTHSDDRGRFELRDLYSGYPGTDLFVSAAGKAPQRVSVNSQTDANPADANITLKPGHTVHGQVVNDKQEPLSNASVMARSSVFHLGMEVTKTDENGRFTFNSLPTEVVFQVGHRGYPYSRIKKLPLDNKVPVKIEMPARGLIRGRVIDATNSEPIGQFRVRQTFSSESDLMIDAADGRFKLQPLAPNTVVEFAVEAEGYQRRLISRAVARLEGEVEELEISLRPRTEVKPYSLNVRFVDTDGRPLPDVTARLIVSDAHPGGMADNAFNWVLIDSNDLATKSYVAQFLPGTSNDEGEVRFSEIKPYKYLQLVYWGDGVPKSRSLEFDRSRVGVSDDVVIKVPRPATIRGTVDRTKFPSVDHIGLMAKGTFLMFNASLNPEDSTFELKDLPAGDYWISVRGKPIRYEENGRQYAQSNSLAAKEIVVRPGDVKTVHFTSPDPQQ